MGATQVRAVVAKERRHNETPTINAIKVEFRFHDKPGGMPPLVGMSGAFRKPLTFDAELSGNLVLDLRSGACNEPGNRGKDPDGTG